MPAPVSQRWLVLATASLGLSAIAALALALARTPVLTALVGSDVFPRALVVHVNLATLIWYLSMAGALWTERVAGWRTTAAEIAFALACAGMLGVVATGFASAGAPMLANYVPYLQSPAFLASLACFAAGGLATALLSVRQPRDAVEWGFALARLPFVMGAMYLLLDLVNGAPLGDALWGTGHVLQFGYVTLLMAIWLRLVERGGGSGLAASVAVPLFAAAALPSILGPLLLLSGAPPAELHAFHTHLMRVANWPAPLLLGLLLCRHGAWRTAGVVASLALLVIGLAAGVAIDAQTTMVPAHYHGTIGAFTLALMAVALARVPPAGKRTDFSRPNPAPLAFYAAANATLIAGLAWSGALGAPRKTAFLAAGPDLAPTLAAALTGVGGVATVGAIGFFVTVVVSRILRPCPPHPLQAPCPTNTPSAATYAAER
ncbi:hypothetical protein [Aromatoleum sp.]|uniref:hypothetical protein n=1 Tax=Aromatoleum sp. TaxID=2307007 RepID=UPI002FCC8548